MPRPFPRLAPHDEQPEGPGPKARERRWQTSQERARVAAELIEEAESLTQTGAIATPKTWLVRAPLPDPRCAAINDSCGYGEELEQDDQRNHPRSPPQPPPPPPSSAAPREAARLASDDPLYLAAREAGERGETDRAAASYRDLLARDQTM